MTKKNRAGKQRRVSGAGDVTVARIRELFGRPARVLKHQYLDLGPELNAQLGHPRRGVRYGTLIEMSGEESSGKSTVITDVAAAHQAASATNEVVWVDLENSMSQPETADDDEWQQRRGLICHRGSTRFHLIQPYVYVKSKGKGKGKGKGGGKGRSTSTPKAEPELSTAQELLRQAEKLIQKRYATNPQRKFMLVIDSVAALATEASIMADAENKGENMKTSLSVATMLSRLLPRWVGIMPEYSTTVFFINQIRLKPGVMYGDPEYRPGGRALHFFCHACVGLRRYGNWSRIIGKKTGKQIGIRGVMRVIKNKLGGTEQAKLIYKILYNGKLKFEEGEK